MNPTRWRKIEELFQEAVDLQEPARSRLLAARCKNDPALRAAVEDLLSSSNNAANFIESPVWTDSSFVDTSAKQAFSESVDELRRNDDPYIGRTLGAFRLIEELGRGGMGTVYLAQRADGEFDQKVAIKIIKRGMDSEFIVRRFRHERQILASFEHPFIARLLDGGTSPDGIPYFVMEYIVGSNLYEYCDKNLLTTGDRLKLFQKVCSALKYAHDRQIIHRDIKPGNILINDVGSPKLLDFGIAKILDPALVHESVSPTASMLRMMTPEYASPEQMKGLDVTPASDIYSLGILLYELLTGCRPFNFSGRALHEISHSICEEMPMLPSDVLETHANLLNRYTHERDSVYSVRKTNRESLRDELRDQLDDLVMRAIAKLPEERYDGVAELSEDISRVLKGTQVLAPKYFSASTATFSQLFRPVTPEHSIAVLPFKFINLGPTGDTDDQFLGVGLADALIARLSKIRRLSVRPTGSILSFAQEAYDPIKAGNALKVEYILDGSIKKANDRLRVSVQLLKVADNAAVWAATVDETIADVLTLEDTLANKMIDVLLPQLAGSELADFSKRGTEIPEAFEQYLRGRYHFNSFTEDGLAKAFVCFHRAIAADETYALAYSGLADYYIWLGIIGVLPPKECFVPALKTARQAVDLDDRSSEAHSSLGFSIHAGEYDWASAEKHLQRALELNPSNANAFVWYAIVLFTEGRLDEGLHFARRSIDLDPLTPFNHHNLGWGLYFARRYDEAAAAYRELISKFPTYSFGHYGLSRILRKVGDTKAAIRENSLAIVHGGDSVFLRLAEAECLAANGQTERAVEILDKINSLENDRYVSPYQQSLVYCYIGDHDKALELLQTSFDDKEAWLNWLGTEPVFDVLRNDPRFDELLEQTGYRMFFSKFANSHSGASRRPVDQTTLVISERHTTDAGPTTMPVSGRRRYYQLGAIAAAIFIFIVAFAGYYDSIPRFFAAFSSVPPSSHTNPRILVLPFRSSDGAQVNLGVGFADALTHKLGNVKSIRVISANSGRAVAELDPAAIHREVGAAYLIRGELTKKSGRSVVSTQMLNTVSGTTVWEDEFAADEGNLFALQTRIAEKIWTSLGIEPLPLERLQVEKSYTQSNEAYELYLIGRYQMTRRSPADLRQAISTFATSLQNDPNFALAYVGMADAYSLIQLYDTDPPANAYGHARELASKALMIDEDLSEAHASMAYVNFYAERDRQAAELEFRRAVQLNPSNSQAHHWFALFLAATGKSKEALQEIENARQLDPRSLSVMSAAGMVKFYSSDLRGAIEECEQALSIDPSFVPALKVKRWSYSALGEHQAAKATYINELNFSGGDARHPGWTIIAAQVGELGEDPAAAIKIIDDAVNSQLVRSNDYAYAFETALAYYSLGVTEKAIQYLERAAAAKSHGISFLDVDPRLNGLKRDHRFQRLSADLRAQPRS